MAQLHADENFHFAVVRELRRLGHDVWTAFEAGQAGQGLPDAVVLTFATSQGRTVLTHNRRHFIKLHQQRPQHAGIVVATGDADLWALAQRIHQAVVDESPLVNKLVRVNKPSVP